MSSRKTTFSGPSIESEPFSSQKIQTGSVQSTGPQGSYMDFTGPSIKRGVSSSFFGFSFNLGELGFNWAMNAKKSLGVSVGLKVQGGGVENSTDHMGGRKTSYSVPVLPISFHSTDYPEGNPQWMEQSKTANQQHLHTEVTKSRQMELESLKGMKKMMSPSDYERQRQEIIGRPFPKMD